jgi:hypothetical protein
MVAMKDELVARVTGVAAVVSGLALCAASYVECTLPIGCVGDQCNVRPQRPSSQTTVLLDIPFGLALALAGALLVRPSDATQPHRNRGSRAHVERA